MQIMFISSFFGIGFVLGWFQFFISFTYNPLSPASRDAETLINRFSLFICNIQFIWVIFTLIIGTLWQHALNKPSRNISSVRIIPNKQRILNKKTCVCKLQGQWQITEIMTDESINLPHVRHPWSQCLCLLMKAELQSYYPPCQPPLGL